MATLATQLARQTAPAELWRPLDRNRVECFACGPRCPILPGARALSFGMLGCDLHCGYCQNWVSSQALRDFRSTLDFQAVRPAQLVEMAVRQGAAAVISTYNEPLITAEWAVAV